MTEPLTLGISPCPNDTFTFAALLEGWIESPAISFVLADIEALNEGVMAGRFDVAKASFHAALAVADRYAVLPVGAALGFGVGPLLLAATPQLAARRPRPGDRVLCPGRWTTAALLYRLFCPEGPAPDHVVFSQIMPALARHDADYGAVIHEGRFTYAQHGLHMALDLGRTWETATGAPLPLGGILARRSLGRPVMTAVTDAIRRSLRFARAQPEKVLPVMARHAQEFSEQVLWDHVRLYVNDATAELGDGGRRALDALASRALAAGIVTAPVALHIQP